MQAKLASVEIGYMLHETEDEAKVEAALVEFMGIAAPFEKESLEGHFGNKIIMAKHRFTGKDADGVADRVIGALPERVRKEVASGLGALLDEHSALYLRIDKQKLVSGRVELGKGDAVRIRIKPRWLPRREAEGFYLGLLKER